MFNTKQLHDFHPANGPTEGLCREINVLLSRSRRKRRTCGRDAFIALLAGVPALRKTPGIPDFRDAGPDYFTTLPHCATDAETALCRRHLESVFGIKDRESLLDFCDQQLRCQRSYLDFEAFWEGHPPFGLSELNPEAREFSAQFYPLLGHQGFLAWDISECVGHLRAGLACGLLSREDFDRLADSWIAQAQIFGSWEEYAASLVCGALYWDFRQDTPVRELPRSQRLWMDLVRTLLANDTAWDSGFWYVPQREKEYCLWPSEFRLYLGGWKGPDGCLVTDHITVQGKPVKWCYRETPETEVPDSGWRFFSGEESGEYVNDLSHTDVCTLNDVCNFDPDILPLLDAPCNSAFARGEDGVFYPYPFPQAGDGSEENPS